MNANTTTGPAPPYKTSDPNSFASVSVRDRWPKIVTGAIDDLHRTVNSCEVEEKTAEGKTIVAGLASLKYEIQHDRLLSPLPDDGGADIADYNHDLEQLSSRKWFDVPWLYAECYLYRRIQTLFALSTHWKSYDVFARQKISTFRSSRPAVLELAARYRSIIEQIEQTASTNAPKLSKEDQEKAEHLLFLEMCEICLWGNATDLSLLTSLTYDDIQKLQGADARKSAEKNVLVNDLPAAYAALQAAKSQGKTDRRVDIVLDNAGFELFVDLVLAGYLLAAGLATQIVLHPKSIPWFVSDVMPTDFSALLSVLADPQVFFSPADDQTKEQGHGTTPSTPPLSPRETADIAFLFNHWMTIYQEGQLLIRPNRFWTTDHSYWNLPSQEPELLKDLQEAELVIFKGDLNYRKLTVDAMWPTTTPFVEAIGPMGHGSGVRVLSLRTCKADTVVGLAAGVDERLRGEQGAGMEKRAWAWSGKWAVMQYCDGKVRA